jgi:hypothetical protein
MKYGHQKKKNLTRGIVCTKRNGYGTSQTGFQSRQLNINTMGPRQTGHYLPRKVQEQAIKRSRE